MIGGKSLGMKIASVALSISAHAAIALAAVHGGASGDPSARAGARPAELLAPELAIVEPAAENRSNEPARRERETHHVGHTHPYPVAADHDVTPHDPALPHIRVSSSNGDPSVTTPPAADALPTSPARFALMVARSSSEAGEQVPASGGDSNAGSADAEPVGENTVDLPATLLAGSAPAYTREAESAGVEANLPLEIVVDARGHVAMARALRHAGYGLDEVALRSVRDYRFAPARRAGRPVAVRMRWVMRFELR